MPERRGNPACRRQKKEKEKNVAKGWRELHRSTQKGEKEREIERIVFAEKIDSMVIEGEGVARR